MRRGSVVPAAVRPAVVRARFQVRKLTQKELSYLAMVNEALDLTTEFGVMVQSREELLVRLGGVTSLLHLLKHRLGEGL